MLHLAQDELRNPDAARLANRLAQQAIGDVAALPRCQVIRLVEEAIVDVFGFDEIEDVDASGLLERGCREVFLGEYDEAALLVLVTLDEIVPPNGRTFLLTDP